MKQLLSLAVAIGVFPFADAQELISNGGFELPHISTSYITYSAGSTELQGWTIGRENVDLVSAIYQPAYPARSGDQCVDLCGTSPGIIEEYFPTTPGASYLIRFSGSSNNAGHLMEFYWNGSLVEIVNNPAQGTWKDYQYAMVATGNSTSVAFGSNAFANAFQGPLVDAVSVQSAALSVVMGTIDLLEFDANVAGTIAVFDLVQGGSVVETKNVVLGAGGTYAFATSLTGATQIAAKANHWLRRISAPVTLTLGQTSSVNLSLVNGDCDDDNEVTLVDVGILAASFGKVVGDAGFDARADLDGDEEVTLVDFGILAASFGQAGD